MTLRIDKVKLENIEFELRYKDVDLAYDEQKERPHKQLMQVYIAQFNVTNVIIEDIWEKLENLLNNY